jgi:hypothetical protein
MTYISIGNSTIVTEITTADFDYSQLGEEGAQRALELRKNIVEKANNLLGLGLDFSDSKNIGLKSLNFTLSASVSGLDQATLDLIKDQVQGKIEEFLSKYLVKSMVKGAFEAVTYTLEPLDAERGSDGLGPKSILYDRIKKTASSNLLSLFLFGESKSQGFDLNPGPAKKDKAKPGSELRTGTDNTAQRKYNSSHAQ